jgi:hypothetical protein
VPEIFKMTFEASEHREALLHDTADGASVATDKLDPCGRKEALRVMYHVSGPHTAGRGIMQHPDIYRKQLTLWPVLKVRAIRV